MPNLRRIARAGGFKLGKAVLPSVTNVNNASLVTACWPEEHGITSNFIHDQATGKSEFMESPQYLLKPTILEKVAGLGWKSAIVSAKDKMRSLLSRGATIATSAEAPGAEYVQALGGKGDIYGESGNDWCARLAQYLFRERGVDMVYLSTTDYMMHTYPAEDERSLRHLHKFDARLGEMLNEFPNLELSVTADHGMSAKTEGIDVSKLLAEKGIEAEAFPVIRDKHMVHHQGLGGAVYVYFRKAGEVQKGAEILKVTAGIEEVYGKAESAKKFHLMESRLGDLFVMSAKHVALGPLPRARDAVKVRTHGSRHEVPVPMFWYGRKVDAAKLTQNFELGRGIV